MKNKLEIELFRVSPDSKYLDVMFSMPGGGLGFYMSSFKLEVRDGMGNVQNFDLSDALGFDPTNHQSDWIIRIPLKDLGIDYPAIYIGTFKASINSNNLDRDIIDTAIASDVNNVYHCLLKDILDTCGECYDSKSVSDDVIRNYLILYGHQAAMYRRDLDVAERYFRILSKCFSSCGTGNCYTSSKCCGEKHIVKSDCGCNK